MLCATEHVEADRAQSTWGEMIKRFPALAELADVPQTLRVMFQRGNNSGKWYDFHLDA